MSGKDQDLDGRPWRSCYTAPEQCGRSQTGLESQRRAEADALALGGPPDPAAVIVWCRPSPSWPASRVHHEGLLARIGWPS